MNKRYILLIIVIIFLSITTIFRMNITINTKMKEQPVKDDLTYWTEDVNPRDGECHCPGGMLCSSCKDDPICKCKITRLDLLDAKRRYESVIRDFGQTFGNLGD